MNISNLSETTTDKNGLNFKIREEGEWPTIIPQIYAYAGERKIWLLNGGLGAGKTTFVKYLMEYLGCAEVVDSPTFSLINIYTWNDADEAKKAYHLDLYRLENSDEAIDIGIEEVLDSGNLVLIEWPELAESLLPVDYMTLTINTIEDQRNILVL